MTIQLALASGGGLAQRIASPNAGAPELAIVVPTYREAENIVPLLRAIEQNLNAVHYEVIFVDDDSPDGTAARIRECAGADSRIRAIRRIGRRGLSGAVIEGALSTSAGFIAVMDCDLQHDESLLPKMLVALKGGADIAIATRYSSGGGASEGFTHVRQWGSRAATALSSLVVKSAVSDPMSGFFMLRRSTFENVAPHLSTGGFKVLLDILASAREPHGIVELPYTFRPRTAGQSKLNERVVFDFVMLLLAKSTGDAISPRFLMFALVGASGLAIHVLALKSLLALTLPFETAQIGASYIAMTWNFMLNNVLTYGDLKLRGLAALKGFLSFAAVCSVGTLANVGVAKMIYAQDPDWLLAGTAGALMAAVFNYSVTSVITWRKA